MSQFPVPTAGAVSDANRAIFEQLEAKLGFVPNLYATLAHSDDALGSYLTLQGANSSLSPTAKELVNLVVSHVNECEYCLAAHTGVSKMIGLDDAFVLAARAGAPSGNAKLDALAAFARETVERRGKASAETVEAAFAAGRSRAEIVDSIVLIGEKTVTSNLHGVIGVAVDFPAAPALDGTVRAA